MTKSKRIRSGELFRKTEHGYQPVNYVSKVMTSTERRYSQRERKVITAEFTTARAPNVPAGLPKIQPNNQPQSFAATGQDKEEAAKEEELAKLTVAIHK